jgi:hypothetical protein
MNADGPLMLVKGINDLKEVSAPYNTTLFKINGAKSLNQKFNIRQI